MAGRGRGGAAKGRGRGRGADDPGAAKARRPGAKGGRNVGEDGNDPEVVVLREAPPPPQRSSASQYGVEENGGGSDATDAVKVRVPEGQRHMDRDLGSNGKEAHESELQKGGMVGNKGAKGAPTGVRARNGPATDACNDLDIDSDESEVHVLTEEQAESTNGNTGTGADADEGNGPATDVDNDQRQQPNGSEADEEDVINKGLEELENLCLVLGMSYEKKLLEFGMKIDQGRLEKSIDVLRTTLANNFCQICLIDLNQIGVRRLIDFSLQLQITANELLNAWKTAGTPYERMSKFARVLTVRDVTGPESVTGKGYLATSLIVRASKEIRSIQDEATRKIRDRYLTKKKKLMKILSESHLIPLDVEFDPNKTVNPDQYHAEKRHLKDCIRKAKRLVRDRKELVLRVELVQNSLKNKASLPFCQALIGDARKTVLKMKAPGAEILFDGLDVDDVINYLEETWKTLQSELEEAALKRNAEVKSKTRSGRVPPSSN